VEQFFHRVTGFEQQIVESGIRLFKLWFTVSQAEQYRRFEDRRNERGQRLLRGVRKPS
jgi:polyphosphate kinase